MSLEHILLGLLQEPASGYDLKTVFDDQIRYFWAAELSQIYVTLQRLEKKGLLASRTEPSPKGPDRKVYSTTPAGLRVLREWLTGEPLFGTERFGYLAQLYFMGATSDPRRALAFMTKLRGIFANRVKTFHELERYWVRESGGDPNLGDERIFHQFLALRAGIRTMSARVEWCDEAIDRINERIGQTPPVSRPEKGTES